MSEDSSRIAQLRICLEDYGLDARSVAWLAQGAFCEVFRVQTTTGSLVARIRAPEAQEEEILFARRWALEVSLGVPVPVPLSPTNGSIPLLDGRYVDVAPFVEHNSTVEPGPDSWEKIGHWLGAMHRLGSWVSDDAPVALDYGNHPHGRLIDRYLEQSRVSCTGADEVRLMRRVDTAVQKIREVVDPVEARLPVGVVHGDLHFWNVLYRDGQPVSVIDLDFLQRGVLLHDLAYASHWLIEWSKRGGIWSDIRARYLSAYEEGRQSVLSTEEKDCLPWLHAYSGIFFFVSKARISWKRVARDRHDLEGAEAIIRSLN